MLTWTLDVLCQHASHTDACTSPRAISIKARCNGLRRSQRACSTTLQLKISAHCFEVHRGAIIVYCYPQSTYRCARWPHSSRPLPVTCMPAKLHPEPANSCVVMRCIGWASGSSVVTLLACQFAFCSSRRPAERQ